MKLSKENGFDFDALIRLDDKSIKALYPEFMLNADYQKLSPTYLKWKKENEETGITQNDFKEKYGLGKYSNFYQICKKEVEPICKKQYEELQKWCKEHNEDFMQFTMDMHKMLKEVKND